MSLEPQESLQTPSHHRSDIPCGISQTESSAQCLMACPEPVALGWPWPGLWPQSGPQLREANVTVHLRACYLPPAGASVEPPAPLSAAAQGAGRYCGLRAEVGT